MQPVVPNDGAIGVGAPGPSFSRFLCTQAWGSGPLHAVLVCLGVWLAPSMRGLLCECGWLAACVSRRAWLLCVCESNFIRYYLGRRAVYSCGTLIPNVQF